MTRRLVRFSLMSFVLLAALISVSVSHVNVTLKNRRLNDENRQLKKELGYITIDDAAKAYVVQVPTPQPRTWQFRVYLPPNHRYMLVHKVGGHGGGGGIFKGDGDQFTLAFCLRQDVSGKWGLYTSYESGSGFAQLGDELPNSIKNEFHPFSLAALEQREFDPDGKISLIRVGDDVQVWIEDSKSHDKDGHKLVPPLPADN